MEQESAARLPWLSSHLRPFRSIAICSPTRCFASVQGFLIVGTARFVYALGDYVSSLLQITRFTVPSLSVLPVFLAQNPPAKLLVSCWPLALVDRAAAARRPGLPRRLGDDVLYTTTVENLVFRASFFTQPP